MTGSYLLYNNLHYNGLMTDWGLIPEVGKYGEVVADATMIIGAEIGATWMEFTCFGVFQEKGGSKDVNVGIGVGDEVMLLRLRVSCRTMVGDEAGRY